jgi:hypothetical protein
VHSGNCISFLARWSVDSPWIPFPKLKHLILCFDPTDLYQRYKTYKPEEQLEVIVSLHDIVKSRREHGIPLEKVTMTGHRWNVRMYQECEKLKLENPLLELNTCVSFAFSEPLFQ